MLAFGNDAMSSKAFFKPSPDGCPIEVTVESVQHDKALVRSVGGAPFVMLDGDERPILDLWFSNLAVVKVQDVFIIPEKKGTR
jgi:hypothetical protein